jgi:hypothetical protein
MYPSFLFSGITVETMGMAALSITSGPGAVFARFLASLINGIPIRDLPLLSIGGTYNENNGGFSNILIFS